MLKSLLKKIYRWFPLKRSIAFLVKKSKFLYLLSEHKRTIVANYLVFEGKFKIRSANGSVFYMELGYGRQIEAMIFYFGVNAFEDGTISLWSKLAGKSKVIIDIGANTGVYSMLASSINSQSIIYAFEPISRVFNILENNVRINSLTERVKSCRIALSEYDGIGQMFDLPVEHMYTASLNQNIHKERGQKLEAIVEDVEVSTLDTFKTVNNIQKIDLVKIDVESHEPSVLKGMIEVLSSDMPTLIVEIWNNDVGGKVEEIVEKFGYEYYIIINDNLEKTKSIKNETPEKGYLNYLICRPGVVEELKSA